MKSLGPSNDDSDAVRLEMRAAAIVAGDLMSDAELRGYAAHPDDEDSDAPADGQGAPGWLSGWLASELDGHHSERDLRDATAWAWDISRPIAEQLAETARDDAAAVEIATLDRGDGAEPVSQSFVSPEYARMLIDRDGSDGAP